jgi:hypothetical protein
MHPGFNLFYFFFLHVGPLVIQCNSRVIMMLTKFVMQPTIHVPQFFLVCIFLLIILHNDFN